jgi:tRNA threonylcarbamoyladenosine biosynthesis protein TsaE
MSRNIITNSDHETEKAGEEFAKTLNPGDVVCLFGDLGAGKTTFTKGVARGLGVEDRIISPTFSLVRQHELGITNQELGISTLYHIDLYRLENEEDIKKIGIDEILADSTGIVLIEWAERMGKLLPKKRIEISLKINSEFKREIIIAPPEVQSYSTPGVERSE